MSRGLQTRRMLLNVMLLLLVAGLGGLAWWFVNKPQAGPERIYSGALESITLITLERAAQTADAKTIRFEQREGYWWMVQPRTIMANGVRLRQLFTFLNENVVASYDAAGKDLAQYGLQPAQVTLRFNDQQYVLGTDNAVSQNRYVLHDNKIKLLPETIYGSVTGDWVNFVSLRLLPEDKQVQSVILPEGYRQTDDLANSWQNADAIRLEAGERGADAYAQANNAKVVLNLSDGESLTFLVLQQADELEIIQPERGIRYFIPATQAEYLLPPAE